MNNQHISKEIYGIAGLKQHGKDTLASFIKEFNNEFIILHFADELKRLVHVIFNLNKKDLTHPKFKELPFDQPMIMDDFLDKMKIGTNLNIQAHNKIAKTPREVMQYFGTEYVRSVQDNYWIDLVTNTIKQSPMNKYLIADTRYDNEAKALRELGGKVIKVVRIDMDKESDSHVSERADLVSADVTFGFVTGNFGLHRRVAKLIADNKFDCTLHYDYNKALNSMKRYLEQNTSLIDSSKLLGTDNGLPLMELLDYYEL